MDLALPCTQNRPKVLSISLRLLETSLSCPHTLLLPACKLASTAATATLSYKELSWWIQPLMVLILKASQNEKWSSSNATFSGLTLSWPQMNKKSFNGAQTQSKTNSSYHTTVHSVEAPNPVVPATLPTHQQTHVPARPSLDTQH